MGFKWSDIQHVDQPGIYTLSDGRLIQVDAKHIVQWTEDPDGTFDAYLYPGDPKRPAQYTLTDFHPSEELAY
jgi:hypothetical protein